MIEYDRGCILVNCIVRIHENFDLIFFLTQGYLKGSGRGFSPPPVFNICLNVLNIDVESMDAYCKFPGFFLPQPYTSIGSSGICSTLAFC